MDGERPTALTAGPRAAGDRRTVGWLAAGLGGAATVAAVLIAPPDRFQGDAQRLMYLHVPAAWTAYLAFAVVLVASTGYLIWRDPRWDRCARAAAEIGVGLTALTIVLGSLWGRLAWGAWWTWDPRLVSTALLLVTYCGYLALRRAWAEADRTASPAAASAHRIARRAAAFGIAAFALIPTVHFSVVWWRSLHQAATVLAPHRPPIDLSMALTLLVSLAAFTAAAAWIFLRRLAALEQHAGIVDSGVGGCGIDGCGTGSGGTAGCGAADRRPGGRDRSRRRSPARPTAGIR